MKDTAEITKLRVLLRNVNMDYSALLRGAGHEGKLVGLGSVEGTAARFDVPHRRAEAAASRGSIAAYLASERAPGRGNAHKLERYQRLCSWRG